MCAHVGVVYERERDGLRRSVFFARVCVLTVDVMVLLCKVGLDCVELGRRGEKRGRSEQQWGST